MVNTITERQVQFLNRLQDERELTAAANVALNHLRDSYRNHFCTSRHASSVIDLLANLPKKNAELTAGIYEEDNRLFRVYLGQSSGRMLVKSVEVVDGQVEYRYVGQASRVLHNPRRLTREEVGARTLSYGSDTCMICGRRLDDPTSVDRGVGPVCWENYS